MMRKITAFLCAIMLFLLPGANAFGAEKTVYLGDSAGLAKLAEDCRLDSYSRGLTVVLTNDIDLAGERFTPVPWFNGTFQGGGYTIKNLKLEAEGSAQGLFRYLGQEARVMDLTVQAEIKVRGSGGQAGMIAGENAGTIERCRTFGTIAGEVEVGGLVGVNRVGGLIRSGENAAAVAAKKHAGGIAGLNQGIISSSINLGAVNGHNEYSFTGSGGIAGRTEGIIQECQNNGAVGYKYNGYNGGGIAGLQTGSIWQCENRGEIRGRKDIGGITGQLEPYRSLMYGESTMDKVKNETRAVTDLMKQLSEQIDHAAAGAFDHLREIGGLAGEIGDTLGTALEGNLTILDQTIDQLAGRQDSISQAIRHIGDGIDDLDLINQADTLLGLTAQLRQAAAAGLESADESVRRAGEDILAKLDQLETAINTAKTEIAAARAAAENIEKLLGGVWAVLGDDSKTIVEKGTEIQNLYLNAGDINLVQHITGSIAAGGAAIGTLPGLSAAIDKGYRILSEAAGTIQIDLGDAASELMDQAEQAFGRLDRFGEEAGEDIRLVNEALDGISRIAVDAADDMGTVNDKAREELDDQRNSLQSRFDRLRSDLDQQGEAIDQTTGLLEDKFADIAGLIQDSKPPEYTVEDISGLAAAPANRNAAHGIISGSRNQGMVSGDVNVGGIAGVIANEMFDDQEADFEPPENLLADTTLQVFALIYESQNSAAVKAQQNYAGGIAGRGIAGGMIKNINTGGVETVKGDYCGGIAGAARGLIQECQVHSILDGNSYIGGIAGAGETITNSYAMVEIRAAGEKQGAIAGMAKEGEQQGNFFVSDQLGGIDGISYENRAMALSYEEFIQEPVVNPELFKLQVSFWADEELVGTVPVAYGADFDAAKVPDCPQKDGYAGTWSLFDSRDIRRNVKVKAIYTPLTQTLATGEHLPLLLAKGNFSRQAKIIAESWHPEALKLPKGCQMQEGYHYLISDSVTEDESITLRIRAAENLTLFILEDNRLVPADTVRDGSYLVMRAGQEGWLVLAEAGRFRELWFIAAGTAILSGASIWLWRKKSKRITK